MKMNLTAAIAIASILAVGGNALAQTYPHPTAAARIEQSARYIAPARPDRVAPVPFYGARNDYYGSPAYYGSAQYYGTSNTIPFDAYASESHGWSLPGDASEPGFNPSLDRARGSL